MHRQYSYTWHFLINTIVRWLFQTPGCTQPQCLFPQTISAQYLSPVPFQWNRNDVLCSWDAYTIQVINYVYSFLRTFCWLVWCLLLTPYIPRTWNLHPSHPPHLVLAPLTSPYLVHHLSYPPHQEPITEEHASTIGVCDNCPPLKEVINSPWPQLARDQEARVRGDTCPSQRHSARVSGCDAGHASLRSSKHSNHMLTLLVSIYCTNSKWWISSCKNALVDCISFIVQGTWHKPWF